MLKRLKPNPIPAVYPEPEYSVTGPKKLLYDDTKRVLQVPWMGVITMAHAHYLPYYEALWMAMAPMFECEETVACCEQLRLNVEASIGTLAPPSRTDTLLELGYAPREIDGIRQMIEVFSHGNFLYTMIVTLSRLALETNVFPAGEQGTLLTRRHAPNGQVPFVLVEPHHADAPTVQVYDDIRKTLGLPFVNTDYRALARWPSYFRMAWADLQPVVSSPAYEQMLTQIHDQFVEAALRLPNPSGCTAQGLRDAARQSGSIEEVLEMVRLFQWLLPGLIANVAFFREQLRQP
ncbi:MAG: hypothetical protein AB8C46_15650 [Burkholderiaceae bacterium]